MRSGDRANLNCQRVAWYGNNMKKTTSGFTIVELLVVIVVLAILATITIVAYNGIQARARDSLRTSEINTIQKALALYRIDNGSYPSAGADDTSYPLSSIQSQLIPKYISSLPVDPKTKQQYQYVRNAAQDNYGILMEYEARTRCRVVAQPTAAQWWGVGDC